jgi:hypothetical protein
MKAKVKSRGGAGKKNKIFTRRGGTGKKKKKNWRGEAGQGEEIFDGAGRGVKNAPRFGLCILSR